MQMKIMMVIKQKEKAASPPGFAVLEPPGSLHPTPTLSSTSWSLSVAVCSPAIQ